MPPGLATPGSTPSLIGTFWRDHLTGGRTGAFHSPESDRGGSDGLRAALPSDGDEKRELRRRVLRRCHLDRDLLPARLPRADAEAGERPLLPDGRGRAQRWLPGLSSLPP